LEKAADRCLLWKRVVVAEAWKAGCAGAEVDVGYRARSGPLGWTFADPLEATALRVWV